ETRMSAVVPDKGFNVLLSRRRQATFGSPGDCILAPEGNGDYGGNGINTEERSKRRVAVRRVGLPCRPTGAADSDRGHEHRPIRVLDRKWPPVLVSTIRSAARVASPRPSNRPLSAPLLPQ